MNAQDTDPRLAEFQLGIEVEAFLHGAVGKYMAGRAEYEALTALSLLVKADPEDAKLIRELQNKHWRASSVMGWLTEAIQTAGHAEAELTAE